MIRNIGIFPISALSNLWIRGRKRFEQQTIPGIRPEMCIRDRAGIMDSLRKNPPKEIGGYAVEKATDFKNTEETGLPAANVLTYKLEGGAEVIVLSLIHIWPARIRLRKTPPLRPAACRSSRRSFPTSASAAENRRRPWFTGARRTKRRGFSVDGNINTKVILFPIRFSKQERGSPFFCF